MEAMNPESEINPVRMYIIEPMAAMYQPPAHMRDKPEAMKTMYASYYTILKKFTADALKKGWVDIVAEKKTWTFPTAAEIAEACRRYQPREQRSGAVEYADRKEYAWERRHRDAKEQAKAYAARFLGNKIYLQAAQEGWHDKFMAFVVDMAYAQALAVTGSSFYPHCLYLYAPNDHERKAADLDVWTARKNGGVIDVALPVWLLEGMRLNAIPHSH